MKKWILERYALSTFNMCPHQKLPVMDSKPLKLHLDPDARPVAVFTAATVPMHWIDEIKAQLHEDVALEVIEKVSQRSGMLECTFSQNMMGRQEELWI